jgi:hypothetical protein
MRKNFVLIDFENLTPTSLRSLVGDHFEVLLFVGANQSKLSFDLVNAMQDMGERAKYIKISGNGPNALDFHIAFHVGQLAAQFPDAYFHIISGDTGFDPLIAHLKSKKIFSCRSPSIDEIPLLKVAAPKSAEDRAREVISKLEKPKATRPRTTVTLSRAVATFFRNQISDAEIAAVVKAMQALEFISECHDGKVSYRKAAVG